MRRRPHPIIAQLKVERKRQGLSLRGVYELCGLPSATVGAWETGARQPNLLCLDIYARALGRVVTLGVVQEAADG
jgi:hypothetical protein